MPKVTQVACPTPGCGKALKVKLTTRGRPSVSCKLSDGGCGWTGFVNAQRGVSMWAVEDPAAGAPAIAEKEKPSAAAEDPPPERRKTDERGFKFPWQE